MAVKQECQEIETKTQLKRTQMMFLGPLLEVTLRNKMRNEDMQQCLERGIMVP
jgi:hypothetical protein